MHVSILKDRNKPWNKPFLSGYSNFIKLLLSLYCNRKDFPNKIIQCSGPISCFMNFYDIYIYIYVIAKPISFQEIYSHKHPENMGIIPVHIFESEPLIVLLRFPKPPDTAVEPWLDTWWAGRGRGRGPCQFGSTQPMAWMDDMWPVMALDSWVRAWEGPGRDGDWLIHQWSFLVPLIGIYCQMGNYISPTT